jgi:hypothetical protein
LLDRLLPGPPARLVDVGGGPGTYAAPLARRGCRQSKSERREMSAYPGVCSDRGDRHWHYAERAFTAEAA